MAVLHDNADHSLNISYGGWWDHAIFRPLHRAGPERDAVHMVFTTSSTADYQPTFPDAAGFVREMGGGPWPRLNHFVALSPDNVEAANAQAAQRLKDRLRSATQTYEEAVSVLQEAREKSEQNDDLVRDLAAEVDKVRIRTISRLI